MRQVAEASRARWEDKQQQQRDLQEFDEFVEELRMQQMGFGPQEISDTRLLVTSKVSPKAGRDPLTFTKPLIAARYQSNSHVVQALEEAILRDKEAQEFAVREETSALEVQQHRAERAKEADLEKAKAARAVQKDLYETYTDQAAAKKRKEDEYEADMRDTNFGPIHTLSMDNVSAARKAAITQKVKAELEAQRKADADRKEKEEQLELDLDKADLDANLAQEQVQIQQERLDAAAK